MSDFWITTIGIVAALLTTADFSWGYLVLFTAGISLWLVCGVLRRDRAIGWRG